MRIYIVFTNYQLKVALTHRRSYPVSGNSLLVHHCSIILNDREKENFGELIEFQAETGIRGEGNRKSFHSLRERFNTLLSDCEKLTKIELLVCSLSYPLINWLIVCFHERLHTSILIDGLSGYLPVKKPFKRRLSDAIRMFYLNLFFGIKSSRLFKNPQGLDSPLVHGLYAEMPELLLAYGKTVHKLPSVFNPMSALQRERPREGIWFLGQPHTIKGKKFVNLLVRLLEALRADHPEEHNFIYKMHHFEAASVCELIRSIGFNVEAGRGCVEELICDRPPIAVYSYRSTALLNLRRILPHDISVVSFAPWLVQPPEELLPNGDIKNWMLKLGIDRPNAGSAICALEVELEISQSWQSQLRKLLQL